MNEPKPGKKFRLYRGNPRFWFFLALSCVALLGFAEIVDDVFKDPVEGDHETPTFDQSVLRVAASFRAPHLNQAMTDLTALGSVSVITVFCVALLTLLFFLRDWVGMAYLAITVGGGALWPQLLKPFFGRARPGVTDHLVNVSDLSFPSGHSFGAASAYLAFAFLASRYFRDPLRELVIFFFAAMVIFLVGISRIYLGVHFPSDVIAGACAGSAWALTVSALFLVVSNHQRVRS